MVVERFRGRVAFDDDSPQGTGWAGDELKTTADQNTEGGIPVLFRVKTAGSATANIDVTVDNKIRVLDAWCVLAGAGTASDTIQIQNGSNAITDAMDVSGSDTAVVRAGTIDDAQHEIAAAGTLRVRQVDGGGSDAPAVDVYVLALAVA